MKKYFALIALIFGIFGNAQILNPVQWKTKVVQKSATEFELIMDATIENEWHMFSQYTPDGGSLPTVFNYKNQKGNYQLVGKTTESKYKKVYNDIFEVDEYMFENAAQFKQTVKITNANLKEIKVYVEYQACKEQCIQQDATFTFKLPAIKTEDVASTVVETDSTIVATDTSAVVTAVTEKSTKEVVATAAPKTEEKGLWSIFFLAFFGGFAALLTPCVFPMIPMTVSFFTKQSKTKAEGKKNAILYGVSIILIYVILGSLVTGVFGVGFVKCTINKRLGLT